MSKFDIIPQYYHNTQQYSTTSGLGGIYIHNLLNIPIMFKDNTYDFPWNKINKNEIFRYRGIYANGIPFGTELKFEIDGTYRKFLLDTIISDIQIIPI